MNRFTKLVAKVTRGTLFLFLPSFCFAQMIFEPVPMQEVVVVNSSWSANMQGGVDRYIIPLNFPSLTNGYILRVTVFPAEIEIPNSSSLLGDILSLTSSASGMGSGATLINQLQSPPVSENIDVFIIDGYENASNFNSKKDDAWQAIYTSRNTVSMNTYIDVLPKEGGYLCLRNMNFKQGLKVRVEVVAEVGWSKSIKQQIYDDINKEIESSGLYSSEQVKSICGCFVKKITNKDVKEVREMLEYEINDWFSETKSSCLANAGIIE